MPANDTIVQWARQSEEGRQVEAGGGRLFNLYAVRPAQPQDFKVPVVLYGSPGYRKWAVVERMPFEQNGETITPDAGIHALLPVRSARYGRRLFGISSQYQFFEIRVGEGATDLPALYRPQEADVDLYMTPSQRIRQFTLEDSERIVGRGKLVGDGQHVMWVQRRGVKCWDMATDAFIDVVVPIPDDFSTEPDEEFVDLTFIQGYWVLVSRGGQFFHSLLNSLDFRQLEFASAESRPDPNVACAELRNQLYVFGSDSIERWFVQGGVDFALARDNSLRTEIGCASKDTLEKILGSLVWLGSDLSVWAMGDAARGSMVDRISTAAVDEDIQRSDISQAWAWSYIQEGHRFYCLVLHFDDDSEKAWVYDIDTAYWHERTSHEILCAASFDNLTLVGRRGSPYLQDMQLDYGQADDLAILREAITPVVHANEQRVRAHRFQIEIPRRPAEATGDFHDPDFHGEDFHFGTSRDTIELSWSDDGGRTWRNGNRGGLPIENGNLRWTALGQFHYGRRFRVQTSARRRIQILGAYMLLDVGRS